MVPTVPPGSQSYLDNFPNEYRFDIEVSNRGPLLITDIFVTLKVDSLAVNAGAAVDPAITWITSNNVGSLQPVNDSAVPDCYPITQTGTSEPRSRPMHPLATLWCTRSW